MNTLGYYLIISFMAVSVLSEEGPKIPDFFHTCPVDIPDLRACILQKSKETIPGLLNGDKKFKIPNFVPFKLKAITVNAGNVIFKMKDMELNGLTTAVLTDTKVDFKADHILAMVALKELTVNGTYDVDGQIMILPIKGHGPGYLKFDGINAACHIDYKVQSRGTYHYMILTKFILDYTIEQAYFNFESLFNGDKTLGDQMNRFLNENWQAFHADLKDAIRSMMQTVLVDIMQKVLDQAPMEGIYPGWKP